MNGNKILSEIRNRFSSVIFSKIKIGVYDIDIYLQDILYRGSIFMNDEKTSKKILERKPFIFRKIETTLIMWEPNPRKR